MSRPAAGTSSEDQSRGEGPECSDDCRAERRQSGPLGDPSVPVRSRGEIAAVQAIGGSAGMGGETRPLPETGFII